MNGVQYAGRVLSGRPRYRREDVVAHALELLEHGGLPDLTMRRLGADLGVQPSALYHHFANKQSLLAAMADSLLAAVPWPRSGSWEARATATCEALREALLARRDGAELVATVWSFGLGAQAPYDLLMDSLHDLGDLAPTAARTLLHYVYGHALDEQTRRQAAEAGAIADDPRDSDFEVGLGIVLAGLQLARAVRS